MDIAVWDDSCKDKVDQETSVAPQLSTSVTVIQNGRHIGSPGEIVPASGTHPGVGSILVLATQPAANTDWNAVVQQVLQSSLCKVSCQDGDGLEQQSAATQAVANGELFTCNMQANCKRKFFHQSYLQLHQETDHQTEQANSSNMRLTCYYKNCGRRFQWPSHLKYHLLSHRDERAFVCPVANCGHSFFTAQRLQVHQRSHTGEKPFVCPDPNCGKSFTTNGNLINHKRVHSGEKPFQCEKCEKRFAEKSTLKKHSIIHTGKKPFSCEFCGQEFSQSSSRTVHKKKVHSEELALKKAAKAQEEESSGQLETTAGSGRQKVIIITPSSNGGGETEVPASGIPLTQDGQEVPGRENHPINYLDLDPCILDSHGKLSDEVDPGTAGSATENSNVVVLSQPLSKHYPGATAQHTLHIGHEYTGEGATAAVYCEDVELSDLERVDIIATEPHKKLYS